MTKILLFTFSMFALVLSVQPGRAQTAKSADVNGAWHFVLDTPGGDRPSEAEFHVDADGKVTGKYGTAAVAGTFMDGKLELSFPIDTDEAGSGTLKISGVMAADAITGDWSFTQYSGSFKATRPTTDAPAKPAGN